MTKNGIIILLTFLIIQSFSLKSTAECQNPKREVPSVTTNESTTIIVGNGLFIAENSDSALNLRIGNRGLNILESLEGPKFKFGKYNTASEWENNNKEIDRTRSRIRFRGHWTGAELGFNNYNHVTEVILPDDISYMNLRTNKSTSFNINFFQLSFGITRHFGLVTGLGLNWNNYKFSGNNNIETGENGYVVELMPPGGEVLKKSKFTTLYLTVPAMLELQLPAGEGHRLNMAAGPIGAIKLNSHTKMVLENGQKIKANNDLNLNLLRGGVTARIGYENFMIYGTYYLTPWFKDMKGPDRYNLEPFEIGFAFTFND